MTRLTDHMIETKSGGVKADFGGPAPCCLPFPLTVTQIRIAYSALLPNLVLASPVLPSPRTSACAGLSV